MGHIFNRAAELVDRVKDMGTLLRYFTGLSQDLSPDEIDQIAEEMMQQADTKRKEVKKGIEQTDQV